MIPGLALSARAKTNFAKENPLEGPTYLFTPAESGIRPISWAISRFEALFDVFAVLPVGICTGVAGLGKLSLKPVGVKSLKHLLTLNSEFATVLRLRS